MIDLRKSLSIVLAAVLALWLCAGCGDVRSRKSKKNSDGIVPKFAWVYSCNPDNMLGFEGYYCKGDTLYIVFDKDYIKDSNVPSALSYIAGDKEWPEFYDIYVYSDDDYFWAEPQDISLDSTDGKLIISFELDDVRPNEITELCIEYDSYIYTEDGTLRVNVWGGEWSCEYTQAYDAGDNEWGEIEAEETFWEVEDCY